MGFVCADVTDANAVQVAVQQVVTKYGTVDMLVTCAGSSTPGYFLEQSEVHSAPRAAL